MNISGYLLKIKTDVLSIPAECVHKLITVRSFKMKISLLHRCTITRAIKEARLRSRFLNYLDRQHAVSQAASLNCCRIEFRRSKSHLNRSSPTRAVTSIEAICRRRARPHQLPFEPSICAAALPNDLMRVRRVYDFPRCRVKAKS